MARKEITKADVNERLLISIAEAAKLAGIGLNRTYDLTKKPDCPWRFMNGKNMMVKRDVFVDCIMNGKGFE